MDLTWKDKLIIAAEGIAFFGFMAAAVAGMVWYMSVMATGYIG